MSLLQAVFYLKQTKKSVIWLSCQNKLHVMFLFQENFVQVLKNIACSAAVSLMRALTKRTPYFRPCRTVFPLQLNTKIRQMRQAVDIP